MLTSNSPAASAALDAARQTLEIAIEGMAREHEGLTMAALALGQNLQDMRALHAGAPGIVRLRIVGLVALRMMYGSATPAQGARAVADYVNSTGWRLACRSGKARRVTVRDVRRGLDLLDL